jgi:3-oxoacyl-[acyl-carrier-protein] synthase II
MSAPRRVVVTGAGIVAAGIGSPSELHDAACRGALAAARRPELALDGMPGPLAAPHDTFDAAAELGGNLRPLDRTGRLAAAAARRALEASGWTDAARAEREVGLVLGTLFGSMQTISAFDRRGMTDGPKYVKPMEFANSVINAAAGQTAIRFDLRGVNATVSGDLTAGLQALGYAADLIRTGRADAVLAGGADELCVESLYGFHKLGLLCRSTVTRPTPLGVPPTGMVPGEAAALLMLESLESAESRGATVLAELLGHASAFDAGRGRDTEAAIDAVAGAVAQALAEAAGTPEAVDCVSLGANGTALDELEVAGVSRALRAAARVPTLASKAVVGETLGAAGALQTLLAIESLRRRRLPGLGRARRRGVLELPAEAREMNGNLALVTAVGLQGRAAALVAAVAP